MRFGNKITLIEHRRCVPEIIGFSNRIAYEPDSIRLIPVRQYGAERLDPIKAVHVKNGYRRAGPTRPTPQRSMRSSTRSRSACRPPVRRPDLRRHLAARARASEAIEAALLDRIPPEEWAARELRCGDAADFQGSERDVMFLSMVAAPEEGQRLGCADQEIYVQRYNVAASRAKDQMWLFHSMALSELGNPETCGSHCWTTATASSTARRPRRTAQSPGRTRGPSSRAIRLAVRTAGLQPPHGSRLHRGPAVPGQGYNLDLVVLGAKRLAIECDGDAWHGPDAYERDLARQRDLERCGWQFFRIRESAFYVDQPGTRQTLADP